MPCHICGQPETFVCVRCKRMGCNIHYVNDPVFGVICSECDVQITNNPDLQSKRIKVQSEVQEAAATRAKELKESCHICGRTRADAVLAGSTLYKCVHCSRHSCSDHTLVLNVSYSSDGYPGSDDYYFCMECDDYMLPEAKTIKKKTFGFTTADRYPLIDRSKRVTILGGGCFSILAIVLLLATLLLILI